MAFFSAITWVKIVAGAAFSAWFLKFAIRQYKIAQLQQLRRNQLQTETEALVKFLESQGQLRRSRPGNQRRLLPLVQRRILDRQ
ncbi:hypothetical protein GGS24DRAFT_507156 [Hypoxylon argillaceum]|nr:hypothetical protein GGS24DRAFT_507156 [Hypoxylon argillaceum]